MIFRQLADFLPLVKPESRLLALDVGEKTIGLAQSDIMRGISTPLHTLRRSKFNKDAAALGQLIHQNSIGGLVIGYPINMDGSEGPRCQSIRTFASTLQPLLKLPILLWDERMTTMAVTRVMLEADLSRARRAEVVDKLAASYILQGVLDSLKRLPS